MQKVDKFHLKKTLQNTIQTNFDVRVRHLDYNHKKRRQEGGKQIQVNLSINHLRYN